MNLLALFLFGNLIIYLVMLVLLLQKWKPKPGITKGAVIDYPVSLLVPFRNELENMPEVLVSLEKLNYRSLQVVLIDDHSEDGGGEFVEEWISFKGKSNFLLVNNQGKGKKAAIEQGVTISNGLIILTTDADCSLPSDWVENMLLAFNDPKVQMVAGPVISKGGKSVFEHFQEIEWASILLVTNFFFQIKKPVMCSGTNMGYRKEAFYHIGGYHGNHSVLSGDDSFLLEKMYNRFGAESIRYQYGQDVLVRTNPLKNWRGFLSQRARWAGKWKKHRLLENTMGAVMVAILSLGSMLSFFFLYGGGRFLLLFMVYWGIKVLFDYVVLNKVLSDFKIKVPVSSFIYTSFFHPFYVVLVVFASIFGGSKWKGR